MSLLLVLLLVACHRGPAPVEAVAASSVEASQAPSSHAPAAAEASSPPSDPPAPPAPPFSEAARVEALALSFADRAPSGSRETDNAEWISELGQTHGLDEAALARIREIVSASTLMGQGLPVTVHAMSRGQCRQKLGEAGVHYADDASIEICGHPWMRPLYDPATQTPDQATACIDQLEYPDIPCAYPVTWVRAKEAEELCVAEGKRLCDAHEWEGGCAGSLGPADYRFDLARGRSGVDAVGSMRNAHNRQYGPTKAWAYGPAYQAGICAAASTKTEGCNGGSPSGCGTNTYPAGSFPGCVSALGVIDQHGNAAEHMNLPLAPDQEASAGSTKLGVTEMKGSWFIFDNYRAHEDWCRWRAPYWHGGPVMSDESHRNYHLGFRCCASLPAAASGG